ncbi:hypothetical protein AKJ39_03970, partial [candidate division MSBL1 archaeon SCGC-AAA259J03]
AYKELKDVERAFHQLKNLLDLRPVYHSTDKGVRGHVFVCILALLLIRLMEKKAGTTFGKIMEELEQVKVNVLEVEDEEVYQRNRINGSQEEIFEALDVKEPPKFLTKL